MTKTHLKITGVGCRDQGRTDFEYSHQTACGYVRDDVSDNGADVNCNYCLNSVQMVDYHAINKTLTDLQGSY